jgi:hypothetical protein
VIVSASIGTSFNIARGLNRIYLVLAVLWAAYCLFVFPISKQAEATRAFDQRFSDCYSTQNGSVKECDDAVSELWRQDLRTWQLRFFYVWAWPELLAATVALPLLVYGAIRGAVVVGFWIRDGFRRVTP